MNDQSSGMAQVHTRQSESHGLLEVALFVMRHGRLILGGPALVAVVVVVVGLLLPRTYTVTAVFVPRASQSALGRLAGVAAQIGVALPNQEAVVAPDFYADLLRSAHVLRQLARSRFHVTDRGTTDTVDLVTYFKIREGDSARREEEAMERLGEDLRSSVVLKTGVVRLSVTTRNAALSRQVAQRALDLVNTFNLATMQSRAGAERRFVERRLAEAQQELRVTELRLQDWMQKNRDYRSSPRLQIEFERLQREVALRQAVVTTLAQSFEQARIEEVRDTPVITVVDEPVLPGRPDSRHLAAKAILSLLFSGVIAVTAAAAKEAIGVSDQLWPGAMAELRRALSGYSRLRPRSHV